MAKVREQWWLDMKADILRSLKGSSYRFSARDAMAHAEHAIDINASSVYHCHTCKVAGIY